MKTQQTERTLEDIERDFERYVRQCYPGEDLHPLQKRDCRLAFFAGALSRLMAALPESDIAARAELAKYFLEIVFRPGFGEQGGQT